VKFHLNLHTHCSCPFPCFKTVCGYLPNFCTIQSNSNSIWHVVDDEWMLESWMEFMFGNCVCKCECEFVCVCVCVCSVSREQCLDPTMGWLGEGDFNPRECISGNCHPLSLVSSLMMTIVYLLAHHHWTHPSLFLLTCLNANSAFNTIKALLMLMMLMMSGFPKQQSIHCGKTLIEKVIKRTVWMMCVCVCVCVCMSGCMCFWKQIHTIAHAHP
jgi:hypothetical protein